MCLPPSPSRLASNSNSSWQDSEIRRRFQQIGIPVRVGVISGALSLTVAEHGSSSGSHTPAGDRRGPRETGAVVGRGSGRSDTATGRADWPATADAPVSGNKSRDMAAENFISFLASVSSYARQPLTPLYCKSLFTN